MTPRTIENPVEIQRFVDEVIERDDEPPVYKHYQCFGTTQLIEPADGWANHITGYQQITSYTGGGNVSPGGTNPEYERVGEIGQYTFLDHHNPGSCNQYLGEQPFVTGDDYSVMMLGTSVIDPMVCTEGGWLGLNTDDLFSIEIDNPDHFYGPGHPCGEGVVSVKRWNYANVQGSPGDTIYGQAAWVRKSDNFVLFSNVFVVVLHDDTDTKSINFFDWPSNDYPGGTPPPFVPNGWKELWDPAHLTTHIHDNAPECQPTHPDCPDSGTLGTTRVVLHHNAGGETFEFGDISYLFFGLSSVQNPTDDVWVSNIFTNMVRPISSSGGQALYSVAIPDDQDLVGLEVFVQAFLWDNSQQDFRASVGSRIKLHN